MLKYLIVGRTGAGKDTLAQVLCEKYHMTQVKSYTTRPKRSDDDESHLFLHEKDIHQISDKIAMTSVNNYLYFATKDQVKQHDIFVVDPNGVFDLARSMPKTQFALVYIQADETLRKNFAIARAHDAEKETEIFIRRNQKEKAIYDDFEKRLSEISTKPLAPNINVFYSFNNNYSSDCLESNAAELSQQNRLFNHTLSLIQNLIDINVLQYNEDKILLTFDKDEEESEESQQLRLAEYTKEELVLLMLSNTQMFNQFVKTWLVFFEPGLSPIVKKDIDPTSTSSN